MSRIKVVLSIFLLIALVAVGIVLPTIWKMKEQNLKHDTQSDRTSSQEEETDEEETTISELDFIGFDALADFFSDIQIEDFKEQFFSYFEKTGQTAVTTVEFLPNETNYPDKDSTLLIFSLSDGSNLPVTYSTSLGAFLFGEEKLQVSSDTRTYIRQNDDTLPTITTEEIESMQEGGYADTPNETVKTSAQTEAGQNNDGASASQDSESEEVQP